jgi:hypothetical protein
MKLTKKIGFFCLLWLWAIPSLHAQVQSTVSGSASSKSYGYTLQVGVPYLVPQAETQGNYSIRFPWETLYLNATFSSQLEVSKGYYGDKIHLQWEVTNNYNAIRSFKVFRKLLGSQVYEQIANLSASSTSYEDLLVNGGQLYEYKLLAVGVVDEDKEINLGNTITGIGYRNPTAIVSGRVTYSGGGPVANVKVNANPEGAVTSLGSSVLLSNGKQLSTFFDPISSPIKETLMLQAWVKPTNANGQNITLFTVKDNVGGAITVTVNTENNILTVNIAGQTFVLGKRFPTGEVNDKGIEQFYDITAVNTQYTHFTIGMQNNSTPVLYINGRAITATYIDEVTKQYKNDASYFTASLPTGGITLTNSINALEVGGSTDPFYIDELRLWNASLDDATIQKDYLRYIDGNHKNLMAYYRMDEGAGNYLYDLSRTGSIYHKNDTNLNTAIQWEKGVTAVPSSQQFGIVGVTDAQGYYTITAIPYSGAGESFRITPLYGQHLFDPNQQSVYLGKGSEVVNKIDFVDKSSFNFNGVVRYDTRGVFNDINDANSPAISLGTAPLEGYNSYIVGDKTYDKGEYWYEETTSGTVTTREIKLYPKIGLKGANIYIDGQIVLDSKNMPVETNAEGGFSISVPIGKHIIKVAKKGHTLEHQGNYPATGEQEFVENRDDVVTFIDNSRVTLVGKVVGGSIEAAKIIGFGEVNKIREESYFEGTSNVESKVRISAKNNIGVASISLGYEPPSGNITPKTTFTFLTDTKTGEYRVSVLPLEYTLSENDVRVVKTDLKLLTGSEQLNLEEIKEAITPEFKMPDAKATIIKGQPYQYVKNFIYRSKPELTVLQQTHETALTVGDETISTTGFKVNINNVEKDVYVYKQFGLYAIKMKSLERYINSDNTIVEDIVPIVDGELSITNNLALPNTEFKCTNDQLVECTKEDATYKTLIDNLKTGDNPTDQSIRYYAFKGGFPTITAPFTKTIDINLIINNVPYSASGYLTEGILLGGKSDGSQTFVTAAPDMPDIILRDPPGSNSTSSIEKGQTFSFSTEASINAEVSTSVNTKISTGATFEIGGGLAGPVVKAEVKADQENGISVTSSAEGSFSTRTTYAFSQTISTSDAPDFDGAEADLYIGNSKNFFYGSYDDVNAYLDQKPNSTNFSLTNSDNKKIYISKQKAMSFVEEPSNTFFVYSQHYIRNTLIPEIALIIKNIENNIISEKDKGVLKKWQYEQQINLWKKIILQNEKTKYEAITDRTNLLKNILSVNSIFSDVFISDGLYKNISFDAGLGEITRSLETSKELSGKLSFKLDIEKTTTLAIGAEVNDTGFEIGMEQKAKLGVGASLEAGKEVKSTFSYTLKDNDVGNFLSVDVINAFDGNGPIFSTKGGRTSCPYEGASMSYFYNPTTYDSKATIIPTLADDKRVQLSYATQAIEKPIISVKVAEVFDVQESDKAEFELILENNGAAEGIDANYLLVVDNISNPNNAIFNIEQNGTVVSVPYGKKVPYRLTMQKSSANVFDYKDIIIRLQSLCDGADISAEVPVTAHFVPACSIVNVEEPKENWVFNRTVSKFSGASARDPLSIKLGAYNKNYTNFSRMQLQYRLATSTTWSNLHTYYKNQTDLDLAVTNGADVTTLSLISIDEKNNQVPFEWYVAGKKDGDIPLQDGAYEIRAISYCSNNTQYVSPTIAGRVDFTSPRRFASPEPTNGILNAGDDIKVSFNEPIFYNSAISKIEISGRTNQLLIDNNVSLQFSGATSYAVIEKPDVSSGNITFEWWMLNKTPINTGATILKQTNNFQVGLTATNKIYFELAGKRIETDLNTSDLFHHYAVTYRASDGYMGIYKDDAILVENQFANLKFDSNESLIVGNSAFQGNIHSLRYWNKYISSVDAAANMRSQTLGNEANLLGFWSMQEGKGIVAKDAARFKHAKITASWDIKPKGESYAFTGQNYLAMDKSGFVLLNKEMDATISFWMKANAGNSGTLFSNGKGDGTDLNQANGGDGKWAITVDSSTGKLQFLSEGNKFNLTEKAVNNDAWHHVVVVLNRLGSLNTYLDGEKVTALSPKGIGGFSGNKIWFGARAFTDQTASETFSDHYTGLLDEFTFWNSARTQEQFLRDQYSEIDREQLGLVFYSRFNKATDGSNNAIAPTYTRLIAGNNVEDTTASLNLGGTLSYSSETPALIPQRPLIKFKVNHVVNQDQMILEPDVTNWASLEGQVLDITVHRMYDALGNEQNSPITWTALINKNDVSWFADKANDGVLDIVKPQDETSEFNITLVNRGGKSQPYEITNIPNWLTLSKTSGVLNPNSTLVIKATISDLVATGSYFENLHLKTDFGFDKLLQLNLRVLAKTPNWTIDPTKFIYSMNIVGQIKVDGNLSDDKYDMVAAFVGNELRGVSSLKKIASVDKWITYFTIYSNDINTTEQLNFKIWDASSGLVLVANADAKSTIPFEENQVLGKLSLPVTFENSLVVEQKLALNKGWTWVSTNVNDPNFANLNTLTSGLKLETSDRMLTNSPARLETYFKNEAIPANSGWSGTISANGGLTNSKMVKVFLTNEQSLTIKGTAIDVVNWSFPLQEKWNWLPYTLARNQLTNEALAYFDATDGDVIKSQNLFAIYDPLIGWNGTLNYLEAGKGYMVKSTKAQTFKYPSYLASTSKIKTAKKSDNANDVSQEPIRAEFKQYADNMNAVVLLPTGYNELFVYDAQGVLKGSATNQSVNDSKLSFITVYGDTTEELAFYIGNGINTKKTSKKFTFKGNDVLGTISQPILLEEMTEGVSIYPSPFDNEITIKANAVKDQNISITLYSLSGKVVLDVKQNVVKGENVLKIQPTVASGVYVLQININGGIITHKVMKN